MAYEKQTWVTGEVITKEKLNHMEDGIADGGGGAFIVNGNPENGTLDKTWNEINTALNSGQPSYVKIIGEVLTDISPIIAWGVYGGEYAVEILDCGAVPIRRVSFITNDPDGYPTTDLSNH